MPADKRKWRQTADPRTRGEGLRMLEGDADEGHEFAAPEAHSRARRSTVQRVTSVGDEFPSQWKQEGRVVAIHRRTCEVEAERGRVVDCRYLAAAVLGEESFPAVGDQVEMGRREASGDDYVLRVLPRRSRLVRPGPLEGEELVVAANIDQLVVVAAAAQPEFKPGLVDRYLLAATLSGLPLVLVLNKLDLNRGLIPSAAEEFRSLVERFVTVPSHDHAGMMDLQDALMGKVSVFTGQSGVGKSTLANLLVPGSDLRTGSVRAKDGKGRHTTTASSLLSLEGGGAVIDTPGIRKLGIARVEVAELARLFPGFADCGPCRFSDCLHVGEPGCAVQAGLSSGQMPAARYQSYRRILDDTRQRS